MGKEIKLCLVGYTYRSYPMEVAFKRASQLGYSSVEVRDFTDIDLKSLQGIEKALNRAKEMSTKYKISILLFRTINIKELSPKSESCIIDEINSICRMCKTYGVSIWNTRINLIDGPKSFSEASDRHIDAVVGFLKEVSHILEQYHITLTIESHMGNIHDTLNGLVSIVSSVGSDRVKACFDFANLLIVNPTENLLKAIDLYYDLIGYTHLKNLRLYGDRYDWGIPIALGDIDYRRVLERIFERYDGLLGIEYCGTGDPYYFSKIDLEYIMDIINELKGRTLQ